METAEVAEIAENRREEGIWSARVRKRFASPRSDVARKVLVAEGLFWYKEGLSLPTILGCRQELRH
jgi:hypothetical protein